MPWCGVGFPVTLTWRFQFMFHWKWFMKHLTQFECYCWIICCGNTQFPAPVTRILASQCKAEIKLFFNIRDLIFDRMGPGQIIQGGLCTHWDSEFHYCPLQAVPGGETDFEHQINCVNSLFGEWHIEKEWNVCGALPSCHCFRAKNY